MTTVVAVPGRSREQRLEALARGNEIRSARAQTKRKLKTRQMAVAELLKSPSAAIVKMHVYDLLIAQPKWGRVKTGKTLGRLGISPSKTVGGLTDRQRKELVHAVSNGQGT
jgi:hypothetical protein